MTIIIIIIIIIIISWNCWKGRCTSSGFARSIRCFLFSTKVYIVVQTHVFIQNLFSQGHEPESNEKSKSNDSDPKRIFTKAKLAGQRGTEGKYGNRERCSKPLQELSHPQIQHLVLILPSLPRSFPLIHRYVNLQLKKKTAKTADRSREAG